ncbi:MAG: GNAT family N-acetyltransferase, partial [Anaerolineae bacterium]|nr:GNAT family N-acetyltransferase [Anaerolineae bacterium]
MAQRIRLVTLQDAQQILDIYTPIVTHTVISFELVPPTLAEIEQRISSLSLSHPGLVCEQAGQVWGYAYASPYRVRAAYQWSVDVSAYVHEENRRCGVGQALYTSLFEVLRRQGYVNAYAGIALPNPASLRLHQSVGFEPVG